MTLGGVEFIKVGTAVNTADRKNGADFKIDNEYKKMIGCV